MRGRAYTILDSFSYIIEKKPVMRAKRCYIKLAFLIWFKILFAVTGEKRMFECKVTKGITNKITSYIRIEKFIVIVELLLLDFIFATRYQNSFSEYESCKQAFVIFK